MQLFANPVDETIDGFSFETFEEFEQAAATLNDLINDPCRAPIIDFCVFDFIEGSNEEEELFDAADITNAPRELLEEFMDEIPDLSGKESAQVFYWLDFHNVELSEALQRKDEVCLFKGSAAEAAVEIFDEVYGHDLPKEVLNYIDYDSFCNDLEQGGDIFEFSFAGRDWVCTNHSGI